MEEMAWQLNSTQWAFESDLFGRGTHLGIIGNWFSWTVLGISKEKDN